MDDLHKPAVRQPFDFKIKALKRQLKAAGMPKKQLNQTVALYKKKVYDRVAEVKEKMEKEILLNAADK